MSKDAYFKMDTYTIKARFRPVVITALPLAITALVIIPEESAFISAVWGLLVWCGGTYLASHIGRDLGRIKEPGLFECWGGKPTTCLLRHRETKNKVQLLRWHHKLQQLLPDVKIPNEEEERQDPEHADQAYDTYVSFLRENTRDKGKFDMVFEENCSYGFRRNLWGMKKIGLIIAAVSTLAIAVYLCIFGIQKSPLPTAGLIGFFINAMLLFFWVFVFNKNWVKTAAQAYALRLIESCERL